MLKYCLKKQNFVYVIDNKNIFYKIPINANTAFVLNNKLYINNQDQTKLLTTNHLISLNELQQVDFNIKHINFQIKKIEWMNNRLLKITCDKFIKVLDMLPFYETNEFPFNEVKIINNTIGWGVDEYNCYDICPDFILLAPNYEDVIDI